MAICGGPLGGYSPSQEAVLLHRAERRPKRAHTAEVALPSESGLSGSADEDEVGAEQRQEAEHVDTPRFRGERLGAISTR